MGFGRWGERVLKTPSIFLEASPRGRTLKTSLRAALLSYATRVIDSHRDNETSASPAPFTAPLMQKTVRAVQNKRDIR